jgi:hypothetical protein
MTLSWNVIAGASYHAQVSTNAAFASPLVIDDSTLSVNARQVSGLAENSTYSWRVRAKNAAGYGPWSSVSTFATAAAKTVTSPGISFPANPAASTDYRLVSFPGITSLTVSQVLAGSQNTDWRIFRDNGGVPPNNLTEFAASSALSIGEGYWLLTKGTFSFSRSITAAQLSSDGTHSISVRNGWNIVGNPFDVSVPWGTVKADNQISGNLWTYSGTAGFQTSTTLEPFKGYYFSSSATSLKIRYPFPTMKMEEVEPPVIDWKLQLVLEVEGNSDGENFLGIAPMAKEELDELDQPKPPVFRDQAFLSMARSSFDGQVKLFSSDFRPQVGEGQVWSFGVYNPNRSTSRIRILGIGTLPSEHEVVLIDEQNATAIDLRRTAEISLRATGEPMRFDLIVGKRTFVREQEDKFIPKDFELSQNYPNPFNPRTTIRYQVPAPRVGETASGLGVDGSVVRFVTVRVMDMLGRVVATLVNEPKPVGRHTINWDATGFASGVYVYEMIARSEKGQLFKKAMRMILLK